MRPARSPPAQRRQPCSSPKVRASSPKVLPLGTASRNADALAAEGEGEELPATPKPGLREGPRTRRLCGSGSPVPRAPGAEKGLVLHALQRNSFQALLEILDDDPLKALTFATRGDPPAVAAVRSGSSPELLQLLLQRGADAAAKDVHGHSALDVVLAIRPVGASLASLQLDCGLRGFGAPRPLLLPSAGFVRVPGAARIFTEGEMDEEQCCAYATCLLEYGAEGMNDLNQMAELAAENGRARLALLVKHWGGKQVRALRALRAAAKRARAEPAALLALPGPLFQRICSMLAPPLEAAAPGRPGR